jgi:Fe-S-cluster-containing dehydrogenase component
MSTNGIVLMDPKKCIGCKTCMAACPYNQRYYKEEARSIDKCTFCFDTALKESAGKITACSAACPAEVRIFGDLTDPNTEAYKLIHTRGNIFWVLKPESGTLPNIFYMDATDVIKKIVVSYGVFARNRLYFRECAILHTNPSR